ncbi:DUF721 domain-containing protein [Paludibacterium yongneupense]|uniref:DUF721 domain-containing protein n=1 Tax=Paludibacterium yongneupense TaxID=400061 RepID=UPI00048F6ED5|nr:DUF721 domain-containing protein [Paludibacterium yongneupense]
MSCLSFKDIAGKDQMLARLTTAARAMLEMDRAFRSLLPAGLAPSCRAVCIRDGELQLLADSGMVAARLRILSPGLLPALAALGHEAVRVKVKVDIRLRQAAPPRAAGISPHALDEMERAAARVGNPLVSAALARMVANQRKR